MTRTETAGMTRAAAEKDLPCLVTAEEMHAIRDNLLYEQYDDVPTSEASFGYLRYDEILDFIDSAARYCMKVLFTKMAY